MKTVTRQLTVMVLVLIMPVLLSASKRIVVDLTHQIAIAYQDGAVKFYGRISSGKPGRETPTGSYHVREKDIDHVSNLWPQPNGGAEMRYMLRITRDGVAMHLGNTPDYPASHGCIRMQNGFAQRMYAWAQKWTHVDIIGKAPAHSPAVTLPAYAKSRRMLRRSLGGGNGSPLDAISTNPKVHHEPAPIALKNSSAAHKPARPSNPLDAVSTNPKRFGSPAFVARHARKRPSRRIRRKHTPKRNPHPNPLSAVFVH